MNKWTRFMDMHSGGPSKEDAEYIHIEAPQDEAEVIFYNRFGHNPYRVSCTCCGPDYSISEHTSLAEATAYDRGCDYDRDTDGYVERADPKGWRKYMTLEDYLKTDEALVIRADEIKPEEREGSLPEQGYVWID